MLPFTRETPDRVWLGFVNEADDRPASLLLHRVVPILAVAGVVLLALSGGKQGHEEQAPPPSSAAAARARMAVAGASAPSRVEDEVTPNEAPGEEAAPAGAEPAIGPEPAPPDTEPAPAPEPERQPAPRPQRAPEPPTPLSPAAAKKAAHAASGLKRALAEGRARASREHFTVVALEGEDVGWEDAKAACSSLVVDGIGGWHLPTRGEAREIDRGHAAPRGAYWTRQRGHHDDTIFVHDTRTHRSSAWLEQEIAVTVCVQPKPR